LYKPKSPAKESCENFKANVTCAAKGICGETKAYWLDDYAHLWRLGCPRSASWHTRNCPSSTRSDQYQQRLSAEIFTKYIQFEFFRQWSELKRYANMRGIQIIGDIPIYVAR